MAFIVFGLALIAAALIYLIIASAGCHKRANVSSLSVAEYDRLFAAWESELDPGIRAISGLFVDGAR